MKLTQFNQSISLPSLSIDEYLKCGALLKVPVGFIHITMIDLCINVWLLVRVFVYLMFACVRNITLLSVNEVIEGVEWRIELERNAIKSERFKMSASASNLRCESTFQLKPFFYTLTILPCSQTGGIVSFAISVSWKYNCWAKKGMKTRRDFDFLILLPTLPDFC